MENDKILDVETSITKLAPAGEILSMQDEIDPVKLTEIAKKRIEFFKSVAMLSLERTSVHDWTDQQGKPYLQCTGAEKLMALWGVYTKDVKVEIEMEVGTGLPAFKVTGRIGSRTLGTEMDVIGGRNANDDFFVGTSCICGHLRRDHGDEQRFECKGFVLRPKHVDLLDVQKAAYSNWIVNAVTRLIGMRGLTWEDVAKFTNDRVTKETCTGKVEYRKPAQAQQASNSKTQQNQPDTVGPTPGEPSSDFISEPQRKRLWAISKQAGWSDDQIKTFLQEKYNIASTKEVPWKLYKEICAKLEGGTDA